MLINKLYQKHIIRKLIKSYKKERVEIQAQLWQIEHDDGSIYEPWFLELMHVKTIHELMAKYEDRLRQIEKRLDELEKELWGV